MTVPPYRDALLRGGISSAAVTTRTVILLRNALRELAMREKVPSSLKEQAAMLSAVLDEAPV